MLNHINKILLILSLFTPIMILKSILTYDKDTDKTKKISFFTVLLAYLITKIIILFNVDKTHNYNMKKNLYDIIYYLRTYYNYFYKIGIVKYIVSFFLFDVYHPLIKDVISINLFFVVTSNVISSEEALLVFSYDNAKVDIYYYLIIIIII